MKGDEFTRIKTDLSGNAIIQDNDGWWNYAIYNEDGTKSSSGWRVGSQVSSDILSASRNIPYRKLAENAQKRRRDIQLYGGEPVLRQMKEQRNTDLSYSQISRT